MTYVIETDDKVARFRVEVLPRLVARYRPSKVLVFGSRARGDALKDSDLDVVIVSRAFAGVPWLDRQGRVYDACDVRLDVELLCYTPEEYAGKVEELGIVRTAALEGVDLLDGAPGGVAEPGRARGPVRAWRAQAERDLENARKNIEIGAYDVAAFLAQQAVEKRLKAAWIAQRKEAAPHTHSLTELGDGLEVPGQLRRHLVDLNADYVTARYPDAVTGVPYEVYDRPTAERKVRAAEEIFGWL
jgi:HEPN domain-containing protein/predicted nucleotidyltransferase